MDNYPDDMRMYRNDPRSPEYDDREEQYLEQAEADIENERICQFAENCVTDMDETIRANLLDDILESLCEHKRNKGLIELVGKAMVGDTSRCTELGYYVMNLVSDYLTEREYLGSDIPQLARDRLESEKDDHMAEICRYEN